MRMIVVAAMATIAIGLAGAPSTSAGTGKCRRDQQRSDRHLARHQSAVPMALDLRTARMRKDPTLLVNPIKKRVGRRGLRPFFICRCTL
jgi:hypothetical protein